MKYNEVSYKEEVTKLYNGEIEIIGKYKGLNYPILVKSKYGLLQIKTARQLLNNYPSINSALNKTEYFMNQLREKYPRGHVIYNTLNGDQLCTSDSFKVTTIRGSYFWGE